MITLLDLYVGFYDELSKLSLIVMELLGFLYI